jgi:hypothetical protein
MPGSRPNEVGSLDPIHRHRSIYAIRWRRWILRLTLALSGVLLVEASAEAGVLDLAWTAPVTNHDGTTLSDLRSYRVYYGTTPDDPCPESAFFEVASSTQTPGGETISYRLAGLVTGVRYSLSITAVNVNGYESPCSPAASAVARPHTMLGDFNGDGSADILWRDTSGAVAVWLTDGNSVTNGPVIASIPTDWFIAGVGDFNGDGKADILWRRTSGAVAVWLMDGTTVMTGPVIATASTDWAIAGVGDFNGDGKADILWWHTSGAVAVWLMDGTTVMTGPVIAGVPADWTIVGVGDFNGDGKADILWRHTSGAVAVWLMDGTTVMTGPVIASVPTDWAIAGVGDFNGDGKADIVWQHTSGLIVLWLMNGTAVAGAESAGTANLADWAIQ